MELTRLLLRFAARRLHVLLAEAPGSTLVRLAVERQLRQRGWPLSSSPADADLLVVVGQVGSEQSTAVDRLWEQVPAPRVRTGVRDAGAVEAELEHAALHLAEGGLAPASRHPLEKHDFGEHADHSGDGHGMSMEMPGGLPMAERGDDRDRLKLDQLHVPFGPFLGHWPAGLIVHTVMQGDVVQEARVELSGDCEPSSDYWRQPWRDVYAGKAVTEGEAARRRAAACLDSLGRLLGVAGWQDAALRTRRLRDELLAGAGGEQLQPEIVALSRRVRRSRTLRWLTNGLGILPRAAADAAGVTGPALRASEAGGDVTARWTAWLDDIDDVLLRIDDTSPLVQATEPPRGDSGSGPLLAVLPDLVRGTELAGARLIIASLDPDIAELGSRFTVEVSG